MRVICIRVTMVVHVTVRVMVHLDACAQWDIPDFNVKHYSLMMRAVMVIHVSMVDHVWQHHGTLTLIRVIVRGVTRVCDVKIVSPPPMVVTRPPVIMVGVV